MALIKYKLRELLEQCDERNSELQYNVSNVKGISIQKVFIETKADMTGVSLRPYILVKPDCFAYVTITSRNSEKLTLAYNDTNSTYIVSSSYVVFKVKDTEKLLPDYLYMYFNRPEFDRYARFNSWGSAREAFSWDDMCDIDIELPPLSIQEKYVNVYNAMLANQRVYERGLGDLNAAISASVEEFKYTAPRVAVGTLLEDIDVRNIDGSITNVQGVNINKTFMPSVANLSSVNLTRYKVIKKNQFAANFMHVMRDEKIPIALYQEDKPCIISPAYPVFKVRSKYVLAEYIMLWINRQENDRYAWFISDSSVRGGLELSRFFEIEIPLPPIDVQQYIVNIYTVYQLRREINEQLKAQIKDIYPILIKGSIEEATNA